MTDVNEKLLDQTKSKIQSIASDVEILTIAGDISSSEFPKTLVNKVIATFGRIDYAVSTT